MGKTVNKLGSSQKILRITNLQQESANEKKSETRIIPTPQRNQETEKSGTPT